MRIARSAPFSFLRRKRTSSVAPNRPQEPQCPEPRCRNRAMNGIPGEYCHDHYGIEKAVERFVRSVDRLGRTLRNTP